MNYRARAGRLRGYGMVFSLRDSDGEETEASVSPARAAEPPVKLQIVPEPAPLPPSGRYGERRRMNLPAIIVTAALHAAALTAILYVRYEAPPVEKEAQLTVVDLTPPPPAPAPEMPPSPPQIVAPVPRIAIPTPTTVATTPEPVPQEKTVVAAPAPAPPVVAAAPPSVVQGADLSARMISGAPPRYPLECRRRKEQGTVILALTLDLDGRVSSISIARSSGFERLDNAALSAVRKWRWAPLVKDGKPVMVKGQVEIPFVLTA